MKLKLNSDFKKGVQLFIWSIVMKRKLMGYKTMNSLKKTALSIFLIAGSLLCRAQQDPMYTQYIFNLQTINPAYAGTWQTIGFMAMTRIQWVGFNGHPNTSTFSFQTPFKSQNVGLGFDAISDIVGFEKRLSFTVDYAYQVSFSDITKLRFGIKGGFTNYSHNLSRYELYPDGESDPVFQNLIENKFMPNFGFGLFLMSPKYYLSLSLPKILENSYSSNVNNYSTKAVRHFYFAGGMVFDLSESIKFKPTFMTQSVAGAPFLYDLSANFLFGEKVWLGGMFRSGDSLAAIAQWIINGNFRLGYSYDFTTTDLMNYHYGIHEIMLSYEINYSKLKFISPRYF